MRQQNAATSEVVRLSRWLPIVLIVWNVVDIAVHVAVDMVEPWRVTGNAIGIAAAVVLLLGVARRYAPQVLMGAAGLVVVVNAIHSARNGWVAPSFVFIGVSLALLLIWAQDTVRRTGAGSGHSEAPVLLRWWMALVATVVGLAVIGLSGDQEALVIGPLSALHDGRLVAADIWDDEPIILSAGLGFDNIIGLPELTEESVRDAGGSWYGSVACTSGEEPPSGAFTSAATSQQDATKPGGHISHHAEIPSVQWGSVWRTPLGSTQQMNHAV